MCDGDADCDTDEAECGSGDGGESTNKYPKLAGKFCTPDGHPAAWSCNFVMPAAADYQGAGGESVNAGICNI